MPFLVPASDVTQVNTVTLNSQDDAQVAALPNGGFVVVWESLDSSGERNDVFQQVYDAAGNPVGGNVQLNTGTEHTHYNPRIEVLNDGSWVVLWGEYHEGFGVYEVNARLVSADGVPQGPPFQVNTLAAGAQGWPEATALNDGGFLVVWESYGADGSGYGIRAQRYDSNGSPSGAEYTVNTQTAGDQRFPMASVFEDGSMLVVWQRRTSDSDGNMTGSQSYGQVFGPDGTQETDRFEIFATEAVNGAYSIDVLANGNFVVSGWTSVDGYDRVVVQVYDASGQAVTSPEYIRSSGIHVYAPDVAALPDGGFALSYTVDTIPGYAVDNGQEDVYIQRFDAAGERVGAPFHASEFSGVGIFQSDSSIAVLEDGRIVAAWEAYPHDGSEDGVYVRLFETQLVGTVGRDLLHGSAADDQIIGRGGNDRLAGGSGDDHIRGGRGGDRLIGQAGRDRLEGEAGHDRLEGGRGRDTLFGGKGNDWLDGGGGNDFLKGGTGADQFVFSSGKDTIGGFQDNRDELLLDRSALGLEGLTAMEVLDTYGSLSGGSAAVLNFGGGNVLTVRGVADLDSLTDDIMFI
ncbi:calcium-binding protein [Leisingera sp. McT4-56]|uniref:calcium-binding protein n=1 Tax=Leisingera sp. McT4-56 TaxID=2881255 RepID=UPI001CF7FF1E|nr:calcium-binding protein [Leisingera sp. McT4-56]MCB4458358.1 hypothetical protein [Leisingera sp. McT4-56]